MHRNFRRLFAACVTTGALIAGGSALASALEIQSATPAQLNTPAATSRSIAVEAQPELPALSVDQSLPVSARTAGSMPLYGAWDRQTPAAVAVSQPLGHPDVRQSIGQITVPALRVNMPANADYGVSANGAHAGVSSNIASTDANVSTNGPALAEVSASALSIHDTLQVAGS